MENSRLGDLVNVIEDASKDLIDELYLERLSLVNGRMHFVIDLLKRNPKLKKIYIHYSIKEIDFKYLKFKATHMLED
jgi:hypothetical protein